jgi:hypothetical protein
MRAMLQETSYRYDPTVSCWPLTLKRQMLR